VVAPPVRGEGKQAVDLPASTSTPKDGSKIPSSGNLVLTFGLGTPMRPLTDGPLNQHRARQKLTLPPSQNLRDRSRYTCDNHHCADWFSEFLSNVGTLLGKGDEPLSVFCFTFYLYELERLREHQSARASLARIEMQNSLDVGFGLGCKR